MPVTWLDTPGVQLRDRHDVIDLSVTDPDTSTLVAELRGGAVTEVVWIDGAFVAPYLQSTEAEGVFALRRSGGWPEPSVSIKVLEASDGSMPYWEWNGVDTSQFGATDALLSTLTSPVLAAVADSDSPSGYVLRLTATSPSLAALKLWHTPPILESFPVGRYRVEIDTGVTDNLGSSYRGIWFFGQGVGAAHWSWALTGGATAPWRHRIEAGSLVGGSGSGAGLVGIGGSSTTEGRSVTMIDGGSPAGTPVFSHHSDGAVGSTTQGSAGHSRLYEGGAPAAGWTSLADKDQIGLVLRHGSAASASLQWDIRSLRIYRA